MKLYTEEEVKKAYKDGNLDGFSNVSALDMCINSLTPVELPSDDEIEKKIKLILSARFVDFKIRKDGKEYVFEGDFIKSIIYKSEQYKQILNQNK